MSTPLQFVASGLTDALAREVLIAHAPQGRDDDVLDMALRELVVEPGAALLAVLHVHGGKMPASEMQNDLAWSVSNLASSMNAHSYRRLLDATNT